MRIARAFSKAITAHQAHECCTLARRDEALRKQLFKVRKRDFLGVSEYPQDLRGRLSFHDSKIK